MPDMFVKPHQMTPFLFKTKQQNSTYAQWYLIASVVLLLFVFLTIINVPIIIFIVPAIVRLLPVFIQFTFLYFTCNWNFVRVPLFGQLM